MFMANDVDYMDPGAMDGVVLFRDVTPTVPTKTGERRAKPR